MGKLRLIKPTLEYKNQAIEYIKEHNEYASEIHGVAGLDRYLENYEEWLKKLENYRNLKACTKRKIKKICRPYRI